MIFLLLASLFLIKQIPKIIVVRTEFFFCHTRRYGNVIHDRDYHCLNLSSISHLVYQQLPIISLLSLLHKR